MAKADKNILVFIPNNLEKQKAGYLKGFYKQYDDCEAYYVTNKITNNFNECIGYIGKNFKNLKPKKEKLLFLNILTNKLSISGCETLHLVEIFYDYEGFKNSNVYEANDYGRHFEVLINELQNEKDENGRKSLINYPVYLIIFLLDISLKIVNIIQPILRYSATFLHFKDNVISLKWFLNSLNNQKRIAYPKIGNAFIAKTVDLIIGIILLNWFLKHESYILDIIEKTTDDIITNLKDLLMYLMGSPIGLKLNYSFNKSLGKFFFYHISLWRVFLHGMQPILISYFRWIVLPGALGFSFQIAMFSDIISIATFHVYCIYVYAARLFSVQIKGLTSLWRLFIGRKYNPLRERVDSCLYSQDQLFIGTLGFTILLFLFPTTAMYYTVFATLHQEIHIFLQDEGHAPDNLPKLTYLCDIFNKLNALNLSLQGNNLHILVVLEPIAAIRKKLQLSFRLAILLIDGVLLRVRYVLNALPLYVVVLWIFNSSSVAGTIYIDSTYSSDLDNTMIEAKLNTLPLCSSIKKFVPDTIMPVKNQEFTHVIHCILMGILI